MKHMIKTTTLVAALAISGSALADSMDEDLHGLCMEDDANSAAACSCTVALVKASMTSDQYTLLHALATTEDESEERTSKITALAATPEQMQAMGEKFQSLTEEIKTKCNVTVNSTDDEAEG